MRFLERLDASQREHSWLGLPLAVIYKFADDQGPYLTALIAYYGFLSLFPLLLLLTTILGFVLQGDPELQDKLVDSALAEIPIIGAQLRDDVTTLKGSGAGLAVGIIGTLYGSLGAAGAVQNAFNRVWAVPRNERPNPFAQRLRSLILLLVLGAGVIATTALSGVGAGGSIFGDGMVIVVATVLVNTVLNAALFLLAFRVLTASEVPTRQLRIGAVVAGVGWQLVQLLGTYYVDRFVKGAPEAYGVFGLVLGLIAWIYLLALIVVLAAEVNVVWHRKLWPRALLTPFSDRAPLTVADERAYAGYIESERHKGFQVVDVEFEQDDEETDAGAKDGGE